MSRKIFSAEEIQHEVKSRIDAIREIKDDKSEIVVPLPHRIAPDPDGCNWDISHIGGNTIGYEDSIDFVVEDAREKFNLPDE